MTTVDYVIGLDAGRQGERNPGPVLFLALHGWRRRIFLSVSYSLIFWHWRIGHHLSMLVLPEGICEKRSDRARLRQSVYVLPLVRVSAPAPLAVEQTPRWYKSNSTIYLLTNAVLYRDMRHRGIWIPAKALLLHFHHHPLVRLTDGWNGWRANLEQEWAKGGKNMAGGTWDFMEKWGI